MALRSGYSNMYGVLALPRLKKSKPASGVGKKVRKPKTNTKSLFGKRRGKRKPIY